MYIFNEIKIVHCRFCCTYYMYILLITYRPRNPGTRTRYVLACDLLTFHRGKYSSNCGEKGNKIKSDISSGCTPMIISCEITVVQKGIAINLLTHLGLPRRARRGPRNSGGYIIYHNSILRVILLASVFDRSDD